MHYYFFYHCPYHTFEFYVQEETTLEISKPVDKQHICKNILDVETYNMFEEGFIEL